MVFEGLAHDFEDVAGKLRQFVEEEQSVVSQGDLAGPRHDAAADESGVGDGVMRCAKRAMGDESGGVIENAGDGVDLGLVALKLRQGLRDFRGGRLRVENPYLAGLRAYA